MWQEAVYVERVYTVTSRLWMLYLYMLAANKKMLFENICQSVWWDFSLKFMKTFKTMILITVCVLFQGVCFYSYGLYLSDETLWDGIKSWDSAVCTSSGQDKVLGRGAIELQFIHTQGTHTWRWPHRDLSGGQGTGEPSHNRRSLFDFPSYRHRPSLSPRRRVVFLYYRLTRIHLDFVSMTMQF